LVTTTLQVQDIGKIPLNNTKNFPHFFQLLVLIEVIDFTIQNPLAQQNMFSNVSKNQSKENCSQRTPKIILHQKTLVLGPTRPTGLFPINLNPFSSIGPCLARRRHLFLGHARGSPSPLFDILLWHLFTEAIVSPQNILFGIIHHQTGIVSDHISLIRSLASPNVLFEVKSGVT
jgi:hypothetical protein